VVLHAGLAQAAVARRTVRIVVVDGAAAHFAIAAVIGVIPLAVDAGTLVTQAEPSAGKINYLVIVLMCVPPVAG
jgi:hypothetical protein